MFLGLFKNYKHPIVHIYDQEDDHELLLAEGDLLTNKSALVWDIFSDFRYVKDILGSDKQKQNRYIWRFI